MYVCTHTYTCVNIHVYIYGTYTFYLSDTLLMACSHIYELLCAHTQALSHTHVFGCDDMHICTRATDRFRRTEQAKKDSDSERKENPRFTKQQEGQRGKNGIHVNVHTYFHTVMRGFRSLSVPTIHIL
jgi:hypothetical protein